MKERCELRPHFELNWLTAKGHIRLLLVILLVTLSIYRDTHESLLKFVP
jgi:hypothetical protein